jgi:hypothetical protein
LVLEKEWEWMIRLDDLLRHVNTFRPTRRVSGHSLSEAYNRICIQRHPAPSRSPHLSTGMIRHTIKLYCQGTDASSRTHTPQRPAVSGHRMAETPHRATFAAERCESDGGDVLSEELVPSHRPSQGRLRHVKASGSRIATISCRPVSAHSKFPLHQLGCIRAFLAMWGDRGC